MRKRKNKRKIQRDIINITKRPKLLNSPYRKKRRKLIIDDRRSFRPLYDDMSLRDDGNRASITLKSPKKQVNRYVDPTRRRIGYVNPRHVMVCKRRKQRRESLFSARKCGIGIRVSKKRKRTKDSDIRC